MIIWGGNNGGFLNTGGRYNPVTNSWTATSTINVPAARGYHTAVWTGSEMIVWGGSDNTPTGIPAGDTIPAQIVGQPSAPPTPPMAGGFIQQYGPATK